MRISYHNRSVFRLVACLTVAVGLWGLGVAGLGGCDRGGDSDVSSVNPDETPSASAKGSGADGSNQGAASVSLPGDKQPGALEPERLGPKGPGIMFLSSLKGYLEPCGCTADVLLGGIERIVGYVESASSLYSETIFVDGGDLMFSETELESHQVAPEKSSIEVLVAAYKSMGAAVTVPGERDFALGADFYGETLEKMGVTPLAANAEIKKVETKSSVVKQVGEWSVGFIGSLQPDLYKEVEAADLSPAAPAVQTAVSEIREKSDAVVLIHHGGLASAKALMEKVQGIDFVIVGHGPREKASPDRVGNAYTLEAYDQGRYVGVLSLHNRTKKRPYRNARVGADQSLEEINQQIAHVKESLQKLPPADSKDPPPIVGRLNERLASLKQQKSKAQTGGVEIPPNHRGFVYQSVGLRPGYPIAGDIQKARARHNRRLKELAMKVEREVPDVPEGEATYIGTNQCARCHSDAHNFWKGTDHASAVETLTERNKAFDQKCIGCHVVGYEKPGGSVLGKLNYEAKVDGKTIKKDLRDVGCETCHGPGSDHWMKPIGNDGEPRGIIRDPGTEQCMECHVPEHSPKFEFEPYVDRVTGEGHPRSTE